MATYYSVLGLPETATDDQIKQAYRTLAKRYHPDLHPGDTECARRFAMVNEAMEHIGDPAARKAYDDQRIAEKKQAEEAAARARAQAAAAAQARAAAAARAQAARAQAASGMGGGGMYAGTPQGAAAVINETYRKGYNEGFAAGQATVQQAQNVTADSWKREAEKWQREAEARKLEAEKYKTEAEQYKAEMLEYQQDVDTLKAALEKTRQRFADAEAEKKRLETDLQAQISITEDVRQSIEEEKESYADKINAEREARKYSDADKVRLTREIARLNEENAALKQQLSGRSGQKAAEDTAARIRELTERILAGDGNAATALGKMYYAGEGIAKNETEAVRFFTLGAEKGNADATYYLGLCYLNGEGIEADPARGVTLIKQAAQNGSELAITFISSAGK